MLSGSAFEVLSQTHKRHLTAGCDSHAELDHIFVVPILPSLSRRDGKFVRDVVTVRAVVLRRGSTAHLFVGWYTYSGGERRVHGRPHPTVVATNSEPEGQRLLEFVDQVRDKLLRNGARPWPDVAPVTVEVSQGPAET